MGRERAVSGSASTPSLDARVRLYQSQESPHLLGFADLVIDGAFIIKGIAIRTAKDDPSHQTVMFPSRKGTGQRADQYFDVAHPITPEAHQKAKELILEKYREAAHGNA